MDEWVHLRSELKNYPFNILSTVILSRIVVYRGQTYISERDSKIYFGERHRGMAKMAIGWQALQATSRFQLGREYGRYFFMRIPSSVCLFHSHTLHPR